MNAIHRALRKIPLIMVSIAAISACNGLPGSSSSSNTSSPSTSTTGGETGAPTPTTLTLTASSAAAPAPAALLSAGEAAALTLPSGMTLTDFWVSLENIEFVGQSEDMMDDSDAPEYEGPYYVNLLDTTGILAQSLGEVQIPAGTYTGIQFNIHKAKESGAPAVLSNRSIYLAGTYDDGGTARAFEIWNRSEAEVLLTGPNGITVDAGATSTSLVVDFNLDSILAGIDLSTAKSGPDGNFTGDYAISPDSIESANKTIAENLMTNLESAADFGEDADGDGKLETNEDTKDDGDSNGDGVDDDAEAGVTA